MKKCNCGCGEYLTTEDRFWKKVEKSENCWNWIAQKDKDGYGIFSIKSVPTKAHRYSYKLSKGEIKIGLVIDHICRNRSCVNPDHLEVVTNKENILRGNWKGGINSRKTHCINGHELKGKNLYVHKKTGKRFCKECNRASARQYQRSKNKNLEAK